MCKLCPVKPQADVNAPVKVFRYQPHFFKTVDYLLVPLKKSTAKTVFKMNISFKTPHQAAK